MIRLDHVCGRDTLVVLIEVDPFQQVHTQALYARLRVMQGSTEENVET